MSSQTYFLKRDDNRVGKSPEENRVFLDRFCKDLYNKNFLVDKQGEYLNNLPQTLVIDDLVKERTKIQALELIAILREKSNLPYYLRSNQFEK